MASRMTVFVDTSGLLAALDADDPNHDAARAMLRAALLAREALTHNYVHVEAEQLVRRRLGTAFAARLFGEVLPAIETVWVDPATHAEAVAALAGTGRASSLVDQVSFAVMRRLRITEAIAFDSDFEREGFRRPEVPRPHGLSEERAPYVTSSEGADLVSVSELAARSGRSVNTIQSWRRRHADFPAPSVELAAGPIWRWSYVSAWIEHRSRRAPRVANPATAAHRVEEPEGASFASGFGEP